MIHQLGSQYVAANHLSTYAPAVPWATFTAGCHWAGTDPADGTRPRGHGVPSGGRVCTQRTAVNTKHLQVVELKGKFSP